MSKTVARKLRPDFLMNTNDLPVVACDASGRLTMFSPALERILGYTFAPLDERQRITRFQMMSEDQTGLLPEHELPLVRALRGEDVTDALVNLHRRDGSLARLRCNAAPLRGDRDEVVGAVGLVQDLTAEYEARRGADELRERLLSTVNHQFRTPLSVMIGHAETLEELREQLPPTARQAVDGLVQGAERMRALLGELTDLADLESHPRIYPADSDVAAIRAERGRGEGGVKPIHVVTVPPHLELAVFDKLLGGIESALVELGAARVWVDADGPALAVMAELPDALTSGMRRADTGGAGSC